MQMTNKELELIEQLTEVVMTVAELKAENKVLKDINEKLIQALRIHDDVVGRIEQLPKMHGLIRCECGEVYDVDLKANCPKCGN